MKATLQRFVPGGCLADSWKALAFAGFLAMVLGVFLLAAALGFLIDWGLVQVNASGNVGVRGMHFARNHSSEEGR